MSRSIRKEWKKHESRYARTWRVTMVSLKKVRIVEDPVNLDLRSRIDYVLTSEVDKKQINKDIHLVEGCIAADSIIVSLDEVLRAILQECAIKVNDLRPIVWINPSEDPEGVLEWLQLGADAEPVRQLGYPK